MAKSLTVFLALMLFYMFYPFWDLYVRDDPFADRYQSSLKGFWSHDRCVEAARAQKTYDYRCRKRTNFASLLGTAQKFGDSGIGRNEVEE
ncbi:MAG: hypothetical protein M0Q95_03480 [Porticoccaceae bacterium]|nr:hypothetical protein [Porticoccaceae bacterium]